MNYLSLPYGYGILDIVSWQLQILFVMLDRSVVKQVFHNEANINIIQYNCLLKALKSCNYCILCN